MNNIFFSNQNLNFQILNEGLTRDGIDNIIPYDFNGKEDFIQFYLAHDGVYFPDGAAISRSEFRKKADDECDELEIEVIYRKEQLIKMWEAIKERSAETKKFVETHVPFAGDAAGNDFFIEIPTGIVKYVSWEYELEGILEVAKNFREFCLAIKPLD